MNDEQQAHRDAVLQVATTPVANGSRTLQQVIAERYGTQLSLGEVLQRVNEEVRAMAGGDTAALRELLAMQTLVLDQVFQSCVERGIKQRDPRHMQALMNTALRAQGMSRQSVEAIAHLARQPGLRPAEVPANGAGRRVEPVGQRTKRLAQGG